MSNEPEFDVDEVTKLLQIPALVAGNGPRFTHISAEAMSRLAQIEMGLVNRKLAERNLPPQPDPMVQAAAQANPNPDNTLDLVPNPQPSTPVEAPKSKIAAEGQIPASPRVLPSTPAVTEPEPELWSPPHNPEGPIPAASPAPSTIEGIRR